MGLLLSYLTEIFSAQNYLFNQALRDLATSGFNLNVQPQFLHSTLSSSSHSHSLRLISLLKQPGHFISSKNSWILHHIEDFDFMANLSICSLGVDKSVRQNRKVDEYRVRNPFDRGKCSYRDLQHTWNIIYYYIFSIV